MTVLVDASAVVGAMNARDSHHPAAARFLRAVDDDLVTSPLCLAEMDCVLARRGGAHAQSVLWEDFEHGVYQVRWWADALRETLAIARRHPHLGLADASLVALADRLGADRIFTFDDDFRDITTPLGRRLVRVPQEGPTP